MDTGVNFRHNDLRDNIWINPNEVANGFDDDLNGMCFKVTDLYSSQPGMLGGEFILFGTFQRPRIAGAALILALFAPAPLT